MTMLDRSRLRQRFESDSELRQRFDELVAAGRELISSDRDDWEVLADLMTLAIDLGPQQPVKIYDGDPSKPWSERNEGVRYASRSFAVAPDDIISMRREDLELKYSMLHVLRYMRDGITPKELAGLGLPRAWDEIVDWVRQQGAMVYELQRDPGETDEEFERRRQLFVDSHGDPR